MKIRAGLSSCSLCVWLVSNPIKADRTEPEQLILSSSSTPSLVKTDNSNLIFASFAGLLQQWPNTFAFSGHSIITGLVPRSTVLYHSTRDPTGPPKQGLEWLAFDAEMSFAIGSYKPWEFRLYTFVADRALRVIYLDGQSASLGTPGFMDSQYALINGSVPEDFPDMGNYYEAEYIRAAELCKLADKYGFEGVVRMNTGFELLWCDFKKGIHLLDGINVTDPYQDKVSPPKLNDQAINRFDIQKKPPPQSPFRSRASWRFCRSAAQHFFAPGEVRVVLDPSGFISFYDGLESLEVKRRMDGTSAGPRSRHRLYGLSSEDARTVQGRLAEVLERKNSEDWRVDPEQPDWRALVLTVIQRLSPVLGELQYVLHREDLNATEQAIEVRGLAYDIIMPSLDFSDWPDRQEPQWLSRGVRRCVDAIYTSAGQLPSELSHSIELIIGAIEGTLHRVCETVYSLFSQTIQLSLPVKPKFSFNSTLESLARSKLPEWREQLGGLQKWLGWATWTHCDPLCKPNEICMPPLWPYLFGKVLTNITDQFPFCSNASAAFG
ncbi:hypothetical protein PGT21_034766 [Puccinia graminis f. sp. tritici]|uniref:Uncharacterized protein n=1 Tax=Puccinia graminis f. sp. tritici TaxID=56615 RepID=A0A5B0MWI9_PUCGR|nr:hypothetical protein PGT21_034766 [Puccinia graminis f. sp. tritici]KAA1091992.1 hypothetical protein PGTUg99_009830 [Puccinia graminis f. sp. tritici]